MKKISCMAVAMLVYTVSFAQGFYMRAGLGYAFPQAGQTAGGNMPYSGNTTYFLSSNAGYGSSITSYNFQSDRASFSAGAQSLLGVGYDVNRSFGVQVDANLGVRNTRYVYDEANYISNNFHDSRS